MASSPDNNEPVKILCLVRHAKSGQKNDPSIKDFDRTLNEQGEQEAREAGKLLRKSKLGLEILISSPAVRALLTAERVAAEIDYPASKIRKDEWIYDGGLRELLRVVNKIDDAFERAAFFGHNPSISQLLSYLNERPCEEMPTGGIACLAFDVESWKKVGQGKGKLYDLRK